MHANWNHKCVKSHFWLCNHFVLFWVKCFYVSTPIFKQMQFSWVICARFLCCSIFQFWFGSYVFVQSTMCIFWFVIGFYISMLKYFNQLVSKLDLIVCNEYQMNLMVWLLPCENIIVCLVNMFWLFMLFDLYHIVFTHVYDLK